MKYVSTRSDATAITADEALRRGAAPDGGLYLPSDLPDFSALASEPARDLPALAAGLLTPFFDETPLAADIPAITHDAFDFAAPLVTPDAKRPGLHVLELFHGPTGAFKDFGARFLFRCFDRIADAADPVTVLAATSGDTGGAVGCAAENARHAHAVILFPKGRISAFQEQQLCCWGPPVDALRVDGDFDACQALVKSAFADPELSARHGLTSANSISIGRLLPQMAYWAKSALDLHRKTGQTPGLIIPTGNLGNAFAALLARAYGLPIGPVVLATNANSTLADWHVSGDYRARASVATLANAMDVGAPSNFERLAARDPDGIHRVVRVGDDAIRDRIQDEYARNGYIACPHTATGLEAYARLPVVEAEARPWIVAATAHAYKFADIVEPLIGHALAPPPALAAVLERPSRVRDIPADLSALTQSLQTLAHQPA